MSIFISFEKSKKSALKRIPFLPRIGFFMDFGGRQFAYRQTPLIETLLNLGRRGLTMKNFVEIARKQLSEVDLPRQEKIPMGTWQKPGKRKKK